MKSDIKELVVDQRKLTWGEIKRLVEKSGVKDTDEIDSIDISWGPASELKCRKDEVFGWQIQL